MSFSLRMRPRLVLNGRGNAAAVLQQIDDALKGSAFPFEGYVIKNHGVIRIPQEEQHYWSPQLQFEIHDADEGIQLTGRYMPAPAVWTLFAGFYGVSGFFGCCGTVFGLVQLQLKQPATFLWSFPIALCLLALIYVAAMVGQKLGYDQMLELNEFIKGIIDS